MNYLYMLLMKYPIAYDWDWYIISSNPNINTEIIKAHKELPWDLFYFMSHLNYSFTFPSFEITSNTDWYNISRSEKITPEFIYKYKERLNWYELSKNPAVKLDFIENHSELPWCDLSIAQNPNISLEFFLSRVLPLPWNVFCSNPCITMEVIFDNLRLPWDWSHVSNNFNLTIHFVKKFPSFAWNWKNISKNPNITHQDINNNLHLPWNWEFVSLNPNITLGFIEQHWDKINFEGLQRNQFQKHPHLVKKKLLKKYYKKWFYTCFKYRKWHLNMSIRGFPAETRGFPEYCNGIEFKEYKQGVINHMLHEINFIVN